MPTLNVLIDKVEENDISNYRMLFESLYNKYSPKVYGFLIKQSHSNEQAEELLIKVFLKVWDQITTFTENEEKKIIIIVLSICKYNFINTQYIKRDVNFSTIPFSPGLLKEN